MVMVSSDSDNNDDDDEKEFRGCEEHIIYSRAQHSDTKLVQSTPYP